MLRLLVRLITFISIAFCYRISDVLEGDGIEPVDIIEGIVGGHPASIDQAPWQIWLIGEHIKYGEFELSGGSLIHKRAALTGAHCCGIPNITVTKIKYGGIDRKNLSFERNVSHVIMSPTFTWEKFDGDWCVLILDEDIEETNHVKLIEIADKIPAAGTVADVTGWGAVNGKNMTYLPNRLQHAQLTIISQDECKQKWNRTNLPIPRKSMKITNNMICADSETVTACHGDSGGPLVVDQKLVGIVSWGIDNCTIDSKEWPNFFGNAVVAKQWIFEQIHKYVK